MSTLTLKHNRRQRIKRQQEMRDAQKAAELGGHLRAAVKMLHGKARDSIDLLALSNEKQVELLEEYVIRLEDEAQDFITSWPDQDGKYAARWFRMERSKCLSQIVKLKIGSAQTEG